MLLRQRIPLVPFRAPHSVGALLLLALSLLLLSCGEREEKTPDWDKSSQEQPAASNSPDTSPAPGPAPQPAVEPAPAAIPSEAPSVPPGTPDSSAADDSGPPTQLRFLSYNLKNYLTMSRYVDGERKESRKPAKQIEALVKIVVDTAPDVLGVCEIGSPEDLAELQELLGEAGLELPHSEHAGGADPVRRLALLSRFPIAGTSSENRLAYKSIDASNRPREFAMQRGILDATVLAGDREIRFLGVHLKSKREVPEGYQDLMRRNEAYLLRKHADHILEAAPNTLLCVYGDFNDSRRATPVRSIQGPGNSSQFLEPLSLKDTRGEVWTHYWDYEHIYSRFDYVLVSKALRPLFDQKRSRIIDDPQWSVASDHRPLLTVFDWSPP